MKYYQKHCENCGIEIINEPSAIKRQIERDAGDKAILIEYYYCSQECKDEDMEIDRKITEKSISNE